MKSSNLKRIVFLLIAAMIISVSVFTLACSKEKEQAATQAEAEETAEKGEETEAKKEETEPAASIEKTEAEDETNTTAAEADEVYWLFESTDLEGEKITHKYLADNKVTLVNVWATYCGPCIHEMPDLARVSVEYKDKSVGFLGIISDISEDDRDQALLEIAKKMVKDASIEYANIVVSETIGRSIMAGVQAVPTTFFADSKGRIVGNVVLGSMTIEQMREHIETALEEVNAN